MPVVSHLVAEQEPHAEVVHVCVSHADVEHDDEVVGFLAASHLEASAAPPLDVLQSTVRVSVPVEPQVDVEQADQEEECHVGWIVQQVLRSAPLASQVVPAHVAVFLDVS